MSRHFTLEEAERLLPDLDKPLREAIALKTHFDQADAELQSSSERLMMLGGALVDPGKLLARRARRDALAARLKESVDSIQQCGCVVKDLDMGLVDFPTLFRAEEVYLCWKLGESRIHFWHGIREGFRGRKPIDREFRDNHRGDLPS